jgi:hypothetical protein
MGFAHEFVADHADVDFFVFYAHHISPALSIIGLCTSQCRKDLLLIIVY